MAAAKATTERSWCSTIQWYQSAGPAARGGVSTHSTNIARDHVMLATRRPTRSSAPSTKRASTLGRTRQASAGSRNARSWAIRATPRTTSWKRSRYQFCPSSRKRFVPLAAATTSTPSAPAQLEQQHAPIVARPVTAALAPAVEAVAASRARSLERPRSTGQTDTRAAVAPMPTPAETRTMDTVGRRSRSRATPLLKTKSSGKSHHGFPIHCTVAKKGPENPRKVSIWPMTMERNM